MSDTRALLLTDVVDSTKLSQELGDREMAGVWAAHDRVARDLLPVWRGREIDKTDGMLLLFDAASDAVRYALAYHRALAALHVPLRARSGLHVGPVLLRENSADDVARGGKPLEVDGLAKPIAARVMALAQGGQLLLTAEARDSLGESGLSVESHGHWMLKGIAEPLELFEVTALDALAAAPVDGDKAYRVVRSGERWLPVKEIPNNLPQQTTSFIGRDRELAEVKKGLQTARLLTLLGMGGIGKTRLSLQVAAEVAPHYPDGVWFLDLAPIRDPALVAGEIAKVLGVREEPDRPLIQTVCAVLRQRRVLFVMDNCEHLVEACAELTHAILSAAAQVRFLASSRESLRAPGEQSYAVMPLPVPRGEHGAAGLMRSIAVRLFVDRARLHKRTFVLEERDAPVVAELVTRLEGIPLALELAAARVSSLSLSEINARLKDRYKILTGGGRVLGRQQTLRALVDWSYDLLDESERRVLDRLSVFVGGFDLPAAEAVCGADPVPLENVLDILASLVAKSLVMPDEGADTTRYRMLETIRDYGQEKLREAGDAPATAARHCEHFLGIAKTANRAVTGAERVEGLRQVETELDNTRAAIRLALAGGVDRAIAVKFAVALQGFWIMRGYTTEGLVVIGAALALPEIVASDLAHAHALYVAGALAESQGDYARAQQMLETCLTLRRHLGDPAEIAGALSTLSWARLATGDVAGARTSELEALQIFRQIGHRIGEAIVLGHLGQIEIRAGNNERARSLLEECLELSRTIEHGEAEGECERALGELALEEGDATSARHRLQRSLVVCRDAADRQGEARGTACLGKIELRIGELNAAARRLSEALPALRALDMWGDLPDCLEDCSALAAVQGRAELAVRLAAVAERARGRLALTREPRSLSRWQASLDVLRATLPSAAFDAAWADGAQWEIDDAIRGALSPDAIMVPMTT
jgi:predicted ATPase/class 3 adenylate cyclase